MKHSTLRPIAIAITSGLLMAACGEIPDQAPLEDAAPQDTKTNTPAPSVNCIDIADELLDENGRADCGFFPVKGGAYSLNVSYGEASETDEYAPRPITITVLDGGNTLQTIKEEFEFTYGLPEVMDLDQDGRDELLVPLMTGNVNTVYAIWHATDATPPFARIGETSGVGFDIHEDGMFSQAARSSAVDWETTYYKISDGTLVTIASVVVELSENGGYESCNLIEGDGFADIGLTSEEAETKFCAEE